MAQPAKVKPSSSRQLERWDKKFLWHPFTQHVLWEKSPTLIVSSGKGAYLQDVRGPWYLDGVSSLWANLFGHRHPVLDQALKQQLGKIAHSTFLGLSHPSAILLAKELAAIAPQGLRRTFFSDNGATAVEVALKMAFQYWLETSPKDKFSLKTEFLALQGSYHGDTLGAVSVGGIGIYHAKFKPLLFKTHFAMEPNCFRCPFNQTGFRHRTRVGEKIQSIPEAGQFRPETGCRWECLGDAERILKRRAPQIAAGILEPIVQGAAGMVVMPEGYVAGFQNLCRKHKVLLIVDEVATGFGRTGSLFACEQEDVTPDILCLAKALTAGYTPLAVTMATEKIFQAFRGPVKKLKTFFHGHTYTAHPLGSAVAVANLRLIKSSKLLEKVRQKTHILKSELEPLKNLPCVGSIRQAGLMAGIELVQDRPSNRSYPFHLRMGARVCQRLLSKGIWLRPLGDVVVLMPPTVISNNDLRRLVREVRNAILHECKT